MPLPSGEFNFNRIGLKTNNPFDPNNEEATFKRAHA